MAKEYIERDAALNASKIVYIEYIEVDNEGCEDGNADVIPVVFKKDIEVLPAVDVRPVVHAHWVDVRQEGVCAWTAECSNCWTRNDIPPVELAHYCPSCGAKMEVQDG